jgi:hypothetical protein
MKDVKVLLLEALKELGIGIKSTDKEGSKRRRMMEGELMKRDGEGEMMELIYQRSSVPLRYLRW